MKAAQAGLLKMRISLGSEGWGVSDSSRNLNSQILLGNLGKG